MLGLWSRFLSFMRFFSTSYLEADTPREFVRLMNGLRSVLFCETWILVSLESGAVSFSA
jgi:hypothetical protein